MLRAGELEVSGERRAEADLPFDATRFHGPDGFERDDAGLTRYVEAVRAAFDDRTIRRGIVIVEDLQLACRTRIEGRVVREFTQSPAGLLAPSGQLSMPHRAPLRNTRCSCSAIGARGWSGICATASASTSRAASSRNGGAPTTAASCASAARPGAEAAGIPRGAPARPNRPVRVGSSCTGIASPTHSGSSSPARR